MTRSYFMILPVIFVLAMLPHSRFHAAGAASSGILLVANKGDRTLGIIDPEAGKQVATVAENGNTGHEVIASPDGRTAYVPIYGDSGVGKPGSDGTNLVAIDIASRKIIGNVDFTIIDPASLKIVGSIPTDRPESHMFALSHDGRYGYTTNVGSGTISVLDIKARKTMDVIQIAPVIQRISLSVDDRLAFTSDQSKPRLAVFDTATRKVKSWIPLSAPGYGTAPTPDGLWLVVATPGARQVVVVNLKSMKVEHTIDVPAAPQEVLIRPDGAMAYVSCDASHKVAEIRTSDWTVARLIDAGPGADGLAWAAQK
jgi:DNA-binding beta-propeller fold protein YncE